MFITNVAEKRGGGTRPTLDYESLGNCLHGTNGAVRLGGGVIGVSGGGAGQVWARRRRADNRRRWRRRADATRRRGRRDGRDGRAALEEQVAQLEDVDGVDELKQKNYRGRPDATEQ